MARRPSRGILVAVEDGFAADLPAEVASAPALTLTGQPSHWTVGAIATALEASFGNENVAARTLGMGRSTLRRLLSANQVLREAQAFGRLALCCEAEGVMAKRVLEGDPEAAAYVLSRLGRGRGWGDGKNDGGSAGGAAVTVRVEFVEAEMLHGAGDDDE